MVIWYVTPSLVSFALEQPEMFSSHDYKHSNVRQNFSLCPLYLLYFNIFFLIKNSCQNLIFHLPCLILISIDYVFLWTERILLLIIPSYFLFQLSLSNIDHTQTYSFLSILIAGNRNTVPTIIDEDPVFFLHCINIGISLKFKIF